MKNLASEFDIREGGAHIAAVVFGDKSQVVFDFNGLRGKDLTSEKVDRIIDRIPHLNGRNRIDLALLMAKTHVFSLNGGTRRNAPRVIFFPYRETNNKLLETAVNPMDPTVSIYNNYSPKWWCMNSIN